MDDFMEAIAEAKQGLQEGGIPSVPFSKDGQVLAEDNKRVQDGDPVTHAEIDCLRNAGRIGKYKDTTSFHQCLVIFALGQLSSLGLRKPVNLRLS